MVVPLFVLVKEVYNVFVVVWEKIRRPNRSIFIGIIIVSFMNPKSQIEVTDRLKYLAGSIEGEGITLLEGIKNKIYESIQFRPYNDETAQDEKNIRWKRTADEIFRDGYVYDGKACTDLVVAFLGLANARGIETKFVKLRNEKMVHSIAEIKLDDEWYMYDIASRNAQPNKGQFVEGMPMGGWNLWKKGRDSWDLGLKEFEDITRIS